MSGRNWVILDVALALAGRLPDNVPACLSKLLTRHEVRAALAQVTGTPELAARAALFGAARIDAIMPITGGASGALPFRVEIGDRRHLVRVQGLAAPGLNAAV